MDDETDSPGQRLRSARKKAGFDTAAKAAAKAGVSPVSFRAYENDQHSYRKHATMFARCFGVATDWLLDGGPLPSTEIPPTNAVVQPFEGASMERMRQDIPIIGTALGADRISEKLAIEQTYLYEHEVIGHAKRPVILDGRADVYGLYVQGSSMDPVFEDGALILVDPKRPPRIGENVVVYLRANGEDQEGDDGQTSRTVLVKRLARRNGSSIELDQHNPKLTFRLAMSEVLKVHRVMTLADLLS